MINIPKGTKDVTPDRSGKWRFVEDVAREVAKSYNLKEIRTPTFESTELFSRGVGEDTDVVDKQMYTFPDKRGRSMTLKPEGTAGAVRMFVENNLGAGPLPVKTYYITPAFRYERPQAGRLREFHQFGIEIFGSASPETDVEVILAASSFLKRLGIKSRLEINSIGCKKCRKDYDRALAEYLQGRRDELCPVCRERLSRNPMRVLDCKEEGCKRIAESAPKVTEYLCDECSAHFAAVKGKLDSLGVEYAINPRIVRGLDYYTKTVFEFVSDEIGAQGTVCGGGRYDDLVETLGGAPTPAIGFAAGIERLMLLMETCGASFGEDGGPDIYLAGADEKGREKAFAVAEELRENGICAEFDHLSRSVKAQLKYADKIGARRVAVIGESEMQSGKVSLKDMETGSEEEINLGDICEYIKESEKW